MIYSGPGNYVQGQLAAEIFHDKLKGKGSIVEVTCVAGQEITIGRHNGAVGRLKELGSGVQIIASHNGDAQVDKTAKVAEGKEDLIPSPAARGCSRSGTCRSSGRSHAST